MEEPICCPQCGAPARITERFWLDSTDGPVEHLVTGCVNQHWLTPGSRPSPAPSPTVPRRSHPREPVPMGWRCR